MVHCAQSSPAVQLQAVAAQRRFGFMKYMLMEPADCSDRIWRLMKAANFDTIE